LVLVDFGMARQVAPNQFAQLQQQAKKEAHDDNNSKKNNNKTVVPKMRGALGTTIYMAPEVYHAMEFNPFAADIWSAGVVLFLLLTGSHAYEIPNPNKDLRFAALWSGLAGLKALL